MELELQGWWSALLCSTLQNSAQTFFLVDDKKMMGEGPVSDTGPMLGP